MARLFSGSKGKSGSKKPISKEIPEWIEIKPDQIKELIIKLHNEGNSKSKIGIIS